MATKHSTDSLPDSPAKKAKSARDIFADNRKLTKQEAAKLANQASTWLQYHVYVVLTAPMVEGYFFEMDELNDAFHRGINTAVSSLTDELLLGSYSMICVASLIEGYGTAPTASYRPALHNAKEINGQRYVRQILLRQVLRNSSPQTRKKIAKLLAQWMNDFNERNPPRRKDGGTWIPPKFTVPDDFDRTPAKLLPLDYYCTPDSVLRYIKITNESNYNRNSKTE